MRLFDPSASIEKLIIPSAEAAGFGSFYGWLDENIMGYIGSKVRVVNEASADEKDVSDQVVIRDRVVVVEKDTTLPDGWRM